MNKKGFTLIELLSVIVVLALILVIAIPRTLNVIEGAEKETFRISGENLVKQAKDKYILESNNDNYKTYTIEGGAFVGEELPMSGKLPNNGTIEVDEEGNVYLEIRNEKYCAKKDFNSKQIIVTTDIENCRIELPLTNDCFETANISETEIEITGYNYSCPLDVIIPSEISGKTVVGIGNRAFSDEPGSSVYQLNSNSLLAYNNDVVIKNTTEKYKEVVEYYPNYRIPIKSVIIPNTVKYIGGYAFSLNQLTSIVIPPSVTNIGDGAFSSNPLTNIVIPSSVTNIGVAAFNNNQLPDNQAFIYKRNSNGSEDKTTIVSYGGAKRDNISIPSSVTSIGSYAFYRNQLTSVVIPSSVTSIGSSAFSNNQLTSVVIPSSVTSIGNVAFSYNQLTSVVIPSSVTSIGSFAFSRNQLTSVDIPSSVTSIEPSVFYDNRLTSITLPNSVTSIGESAFWGNQLTSVDIPSSVTSIGTGAFSRNQLTNITIPNSVTSIGSSAFSNNQLTSLTIPSSITNISNMAFSDNQLTNITLPNSVTSIGYYAFSNNSLTSITIPNNVTLSEYSFSLSFYSSYVIDYNKSGGTYTRLSQNGVWTKQ